MSVPDNTRGCQSVPNVNIPETETIKLVRTYQEKRRRQPLKKNYGHGRTGEEKTRRRWIDNNREDMNKYELTADMTEDRQYWKMMVKTDPQRCGDGERKVSC